MSADQLDALPVLAPEATRLAPVRQPSRALIASVAPVVQAAVAAAGGFLAGAAFVGLVLRRRRRPGTLAKRGRAGKRGAGARRAGGRAGELVQIVGSRSLLVDVHLLGGPGGND
jgi:protein involved in polysaccharide export with SLBB domain